ncbi:MAG: hypothetical protein LUC25_02880 [Ruminococcus sp.]|nr:hypothetical protein [Ruminococcus sp.]MCD8328024.1 hypothetical protein [Ruminococcus sp.]
MALDSELVKTLVQFALAMLGIMAAIAIVTLITPKLAAFIDKHRKKKPSPFGVEGKEEDEVRGMFDAQRDKDFDPNYKIYNEDIYGFNKKPKKERNNNGKEQSEDGSGNNLDE